MMEERAFMALVLMRTSGSFSTRMSWGRQRRDGGEEGREGGREGGEGGVTVVTNTGRTALTCCR